METVQDFIANQLNVEKLPCTTILVQKSLNLNQNDACNALEGFYNENKTKMPGLNCKHSMCGTIGSRIVVKVVDEGDLDQMAQSMDEVVQQQIYSIQLADLPLSNITVVNENIKKELTQENMIQWGMILTKTDGLKEGSIVQVESDIKKEQAPIQRSSTTSTKAEPVKKEESTFKSRYVSRKAQTVPTPVEKAKPVYVSRKKALEQPKERVVKKPKILPKSAQPKGELLNLFDDEDDVVMAGDGTKDDKFSDDEDSLMEIDAPEPEQPESEPAQTLQSFKEQSKPEEPAPSVAETVPAFESVKDEDGFMVMKRNTPTPSSSTAKKLQSNAAANFEVKKPSTGAKKQKQSTLMNFFKKKS